MYAVLTHRQTFHSGQLKKKITCVSRSEGGRAAHEEGRVVSKKKKTGKGVSQLAPFFFTGKT